MRRTALVTLTLVAVGTLAGCSADAVDKTDVEEQISTQLEAEVGQTPDRIECPGDLDAEVGATMTCLLYAGEDNIDVDVEVTSVDGDEVNFSIQVAEEVN
ncbi:DUF4333 domain-containing protein [Nocardioides sp. GCM10027113]|uniref:DUF4333 domain-containing protein n=1 Tax=unclassified Nocardioides TaxID=2615069 RepID=UPI00360D7058